MKERRPFRILAANILLKTLFVSLIGPALSGCESSKEADAISTQGGIFLAPPTPGGGPPLATFSTAAGVCDVLDIFDFPNMIQLFTRWDHGVVRSIEIGMLPDRKPGWRGYGSKIKAGGTVSFGLSVQFDPESAFDFEIQEFTSDDRLIITRHGFGGGLFVRETYTNPLTQEVVTFDAEVIGGEIQPPHVQEPEEVNLPALAPSVFGNADGERMIALLNEPGFSSWLDHELSDIYGVSKAGDGSGGGCPSWLGDGAGLCAILKCTFGGGWLNPLCHACTGAAIACNIANLACNYLVDCD